MNYAIGVALAFPIAFLARTAGFDRDRSFYPTVLIVIASYYLLFAVIGGSTRALAVEAAAMAVFVTIAVAGHRLNQWLVVGGIAAHALFDFFVHPFITNPGVPAWWPGFCGSIDLALAVLFGAVLMQRGKQTTD